MRAAFRRWRTGRAPWVSILQVSLLTLVVWFITVKYFFTRHYVTPLGDAWGVADDVYITADFARTLAHGGGPLWYEGAPRVEGFSSPLWVLVLALLHRNPAFSEDTLGVHVLAVNLPIAFGLCLAIWILVSPRDENHRRHAPSWGTWSGLLLLLLTCISLHHWSAGGFETGLTALLPMVAFALAAGPASQRRATTIGLLLGAAFWSRMDSALLCWPLLGAMWLEPRWRGHTQRAAALWLLAAIALFGLRRAYFGEWLPNTYYLKATGWPLAVRVPQGYLQNRPALFCLLFGVVPLSAFLLRRVSSRRNEIVALLLAHTGTLLYSTWLGGDFSWERFGYDRFTGTSSLFLVCALTRLVGEASMRKSLRASAAALATLSVALPIFTYVNFWGLWQWRQPVHFRALLELRRGLDSNDVMSASFVYWGKAAEQISKPGALVATCAAGAIPYFSKRKAIDLLGKVDKHVARQPVPASIPPEFRCWRPWPGAGHNKEDLEHSFAERPDVSTVEPPARYREEFEKLSHAGLEFWVRRDSDFVVTPGAKPR
jgi:arabinofuranosyltransferase